MDGSIYLFQHMNKSSPHRGGKYRAKRENKLFEIEVPESRDDKNKKKKNDLFGERNDKQVYQSTLIKPSLGYAVGLVRPGANELHLVPVEAIAQFRPSFAYLNNKSSDPAKKVVEEDPSSQSESEMPDETVKTVTMRFAGPNEEKFKKAREQSYHHLQQKREQEEWADISYYSVTSDESFKAKSSLICRSQDRSRPLPKAAADDKRSKSPSKEGHSSKGIRDDDEATIISNVEDFLKVLS